MIEKTIQELTAAIKQLTAALHKSDAPQDVELPTVHVKPSNLPSVEPTPAPIAEPVIMEESPIRTSKVTQADLRDVASKLLVQKKLPEILRINKEHGIRKISECPEEKYEAVYSSLTAALATSETS